MFAFDGGSCKTFTAHYQDLIRMQVIQIEQT